jgi:hypothetical protein
MNIFHHIPIIKTSAIKFFDLSKKEFLEFLNPIPYYRKILNNISILIKKKKKL